MKKTYFLFLLAILFLCCQTKNEKHLFYLHGRIVEVQGIHAVSEQFGAYQYEDIINTLKQAGAVLHHEVRTTETDFQDFSIKISNQIDSLIQSGVSPNDITVIGASKGAVMTMNISHLNSNPINYVLLGANNDYIENENQWNLHGRILGIYEKSDNLAGKNYQYWVHASPRAVSFEQIEINTGLGHGFLYQPLEAWLKPAFKWIEETN